MDGLTEGRIVHYVLCQADVDAITLFRKAPRLSVTGELLCPPIAQDHIGNPVSEGEHVPMMVVAVWGENGCINGQVFLDGNDSLWVTSRSFDESGKPATWHWIEKA